ncbi:hypothetical protein ACPB67_00045 [Micromonospora taraxaci]|uniref:hypothetical protein n=1 Tax=Micromonospora taraxaci TaxID=1316803 RepID=UPI003C30413E
MDTVTAQLLAAAIGASGALVGSLSTQVITRRGERERARQEVSSRWLNDRRSLIAELLSFTVQLEGKLLELKFDLDTAQTEGIPGKLREGGFRRLSEIPDSDDGDTFLQSLNSSVSFEMLNSFLDQQWRNVDELQHLLAKISLISSAMIAFRVEMVVAHLQVTLGAVDELKTWVEVEEEYFELRSDRFELQAAVRKDLGILDRQDDYLRIGRLLEKVRKGTGLRS